MIKIFLIMVVLFTSVSFAVDVANTESWVKFSSFNYEGKAVVTPGAGEYQNPIIAGFYPDPSICRVGEDYYLATSSFNYFPAIPIWHSRDLVNWTQIGHVLDRPSQFAITGGQVSAGTFAPAIRYNKGTYYVVCTLVGGIGNFYVTASDPRGPWSEPIRLPDVGGIDPSLFFDDDGRCYVTNCDDPVGPALYEGHRTIRLQEVDLAQKKTVGEKTVLVNGGTDISKKPIWCEAPHLYKINGTYYLMCAQGGTSVDHTEVIFRSDSLRGPYVPWDNNPILSSAELPADRPNPITCTGHADLFQTQNGQWYAVFLACQPYKAGFYNTGRQTFLLPVTWQDGWPVILPHDTPVPLVVKKPDLPADKAPALATTGNISFTDNFDSDTLPFRWVGLRAPTSEWYSLSKSEKALFLEPRSQLLSGQGDPSFLAVRQQNNDFSCSVTLAAQPGTADCSAGLVAFQNEGHYYAVNVKIVSGRLSQVAIEQSAPVTGIRRNAVGSRPEPKILASAVLPNTTKSIELKIEGKGPEMKVFYKAGSADFVQLGGTLESSFLSTETAGGFQGVTLGMFAIKGSNE